MLLKIALNGARTKSESPYIPHSLDEIEREVKSLYKRSYKVHHIHCYDKHGKESLKPGDVNNLVSVIRNISPEIQLGISTGEWIEPNLEKRIDQIKSWELVPDFASVNMIEENAIAIAELLIDKGILVEPGLDGKEAAEIFVKSDIKNGCCRVLIEPPEVSLASAMITVNEIENVLDLSRISIKRLLHGFNSISWDILREAKKRGYDTRIGMEDTIYLQDGKKTASNLEIVNHAIEILNAV